MSVVDDSRIEELERMARSLTIRVDRLEADVASPPRASASSRQRGGRADLMPSPTPAAEPTWLPTVSLSTPPPPRATELGPSATSPDSHQRFEDLLGGRMLAWLGGVAVMTGFTLFFAYAISRGWIDEGARVSGGGVASLALLFFGIWLHDRRGRTDAARTVVAVAVAALFVTVVVASRVYSLIPVAVGFVLALAVGAAGGALAVRWNAKVIAAMGIIGALLAPVLVGAPEDAATLVVLFAATLSAVGVLLWRRWDWLGFGVLLVSAPQWIAWLATGQRSIAGAVLVLAAFGALGHLAAIGFELRLPESALRPSSSLLLALNALVVAIAGYGALAGAGQRNAAGVWLVLLAVAHLLVALLANRLARVSADIRLLLMTLGVLLGDAGLAVLAHGSVLAIGFAATSVLFARLVARNSERRHDHVLTELGLGGHLAGALLIAVVQATPSGFLGQGAGSPATATIALAAVAAAAFTSARLTTSSHAAWRAGLITVGLVVVAYLTAINLGGAWLVLAWAVEAVALARIGRRTGDGIAGVAALSFLAGAAIHALVIEAPPRALALGATDLAAAALAVGACAAASLMIARTRLSVSGRDMVPPLIGAASLALLYLASILIVSAFQPSVIQPGDAVLALTVRQQGQMLLSCLWGVAGVSALILGLRGDHRLLRLGALGVLLVTAAKVFLYDLSTLDSGYRIGSLIALGLLLLLGAYAYQRLRPPPAPDLRTVPPALR